MCDQKILDNITIVLHKPKYPENIGAAARAMRNMGLKELVVVAPYNPDPEKIAKMATHVSTDIIHNLKRYEELSCALAPFGYVVGTTARKGRQRREVMRPFQMAEKLIPMAARNRVAVVFGPEDRGLTNDELSLCHEFVNIPTAAFSSLNLSQAVMVLCYEMFLAAGRFYNKEEPAAQPRLAGHMELAGMYDQMGEVFEQVDFNNPENPNHRIDRFRRFLGRYPLRAAEVRIVRALLAQIIRYGKEQYGKGLESDKPPSDDTRNKCRKS